MRKILLFLVSVCLLLSVVGCNDSANNNSQQSSETATYPAIAEYSEDGAKKSFRMFPYYWLEDDAFEATCKGLLEDGDCIDEITLFCDNMHTPYMTEDELTRYSTILTERIKTLKELGFKTVGINMLQTLGHGDYGTGWLTTAPFQTAVDKNGNASVNQLCPRSEKCMNYLIHKYEVYAATDPDYIWVDDDFRVPDKTATYTCFCANCVSTFNNEQGTSYTRDKLVEALEKNDEDGQELRYAWSRFNCDIYNELLENIEEAVHGVDEDIELGHMVVHIQANGYLLSNQSEQVEALKATRVRPGGGVFDESEPFEFLCKIYGVADQVADIANIPDRQYELEDWPQTGNKSGKMHILECTAALLAGCNGLSFASVPPDTGNDEVMNAIRSASTMWDEIVDVSDGWELYGGNAQYNKDYSIYADSGHYFSQYGHYYKRDEEKFFLSGYMPYTPYTDNSTVTVLSGDMVNSLSESEIKEIFSKGVILNGLAANRLQQMGYGDLIGCSRVSYVLTSSNEIYTDHELNGKAAGTYKYMYGNEAYTFTLAEGAEALATAISVTNVQIGVSSYVYENSLGGRVVVFGQQAWEYLDIWQRQEQSNNLIDWLSKGQMATKVLNDTNIVTLLKQPEDRSKFMLMVVNAYLDDTVDDLQIRIVGEYKGTMSYYDHNGVKQTLSADKVKVSDGYTTLSLPSMEGWDFAVIFTE